ncbi:MAG: hypothetical protein ACRDT6_15185 [Micromonosporaceae bacterium]
MTYDPGYGQPNYGPPPGGAPGYGPPPGYGQDQQASSPFASDPSPVPDVSQPISGFPPPPGPPMSGPPMSGPPMSGPPMSGPPMPPPISGAPASPAYGPPGGAPADRGPRPATVNAAVGLTFVGVALAFVGTVLSHLFISELTSLGADSSAAEDLKNIGKGWTLIGAGANLIAAAGASVCAVLSLRGSNGARITLAVLCGLFAGWKLTCGGWSAITLTGDSSDYEAIGDAMPFWYGAIAIDLVLLVVAIVILSLLLVGSSNRWFSPPRTPTRY